MILYMISYSREIDGRGVGGHFNDLRSILLSLTSEYFVVVIGDRIPSALRDVENIICIKHSILNIYNIIKCKYFDYNSVSVIHSFDQRSGMFGSLLAARTRLPLIVTKAGGPKPALLYPAFRNVVVTHVADYEHFSNKKLFPPKSVNLIPNRIFYRGQRNVARENPFSGFPTDSFKVMRISRIGADYYNDILKTINFVHELNSWGLKSCLAVIGEVEDKNVHDSIVSSMSPDCMVCHVAPEYTEDAFELMHHADCVVGAGRTVMEAMPLRKFIFFVTRKLDTPCLLHEQTYKVAFAENFSNRVDIDDCTVRRALETFFHMKNDEVSKESYYDFLETSFHRDFSTSPDGNKYEELYGRDLEYERNFDTIIFFIQRVISLIARKYVKFQYKYLRSKA